MEKLQINLRKHKKLFGVLGLIFIVCLECCVFPVGSFSLGGDRILVFINFATAIGISKCLGEIEAFIFPKVTWLWIFILNFGILLCVCSGEVNGTILSDFSYFPFAVIGMIAGSIGIIMVFHKSKNEKDN